MTRRLTRAVRGGRGEFFALYERGLLHGARAGRRCWTWEEIAELNLTPPPDPRGDAPGRHHKCSMRFTDGSRALIDRYTTEAPVLIDGIRAGTASTQPPSSTRQVIPWLWAAPILLGAFGTTAVQLIRHLVASQEAESTYVWYATAVIVCLVGAVFSLLATIALVVLCAKAFRTRQGRRPTWHEPERP